MAGIRPYSPIQPKGAQALAQMAIAAHVPATIAVKHAIGINRPFGLPPFNAR